MTDCPIRVLTPTYLVDRLHKRFTSAAPGKDIRLIPFEPDGTCLDDPAHAKALLSYFPNDRFRGRPFGRAQVQKMLEQAPELEWFQTNASGTDSILVPQLVASDIIVTNGGSINQIPVAESVMALILGVSKRIPNHIRHQDRREWQRYEKLELRGSTVVIVGYGHIGKEVARLCDAFGMRVEVVRLRVDKGAQFAASVFGPDQILEALSQGDYVVLLAASMPNREPLIGSREIAVMKETAWLLNVGRGNLVDENALIHALKHHTIAGAALDVFENEPLSGESELWHLPNAVLTPHNSASTPHQDRRTIDLFTDNFKRWVSGETLLNIIDKGRGY